MHAFCTYCSAGKSREAGEIAAIRRYQSKRIEAVYVAAQQLGVEFYILSGEFGLIAPDRPIPWYDHLLLENEVPALVERIVEQLAQYSITRLVYFSQSLDRDPAIIPYHEALAMACARLGVSFMMIELSPELK
jgi:hypothetical protein